jgi:hypothetical protein
MRADKPTEDAPSLIALRPLTHALPYLPCAGRPATQPKIGDAKP